MISWLPHEIITRHIRVQEHVAVAHAAIIMLYLKHLHSDSGVDRTYHARDTAARAHTIVSGSRFSKANFSEYIRFRPLDRRDAASLSSLGLDKLCFYFNLLCFSVMLVTCAYYAFKVNLLCSIMLQKLSMVNIPKNYNNYREQNLHCHTEKGAIQ